MVDAVEVADMYILQESVCEISGLPNIPETSEPYHECQKEIQKYCARENNTICVNPTRVRLKIRINNNGMRKEPYWECGSRKICFGACVCLGCFACAWVILFVYI